MFVSSPRIFSNARKRFSENFIGLMQFALARKYEYWSSHAWFTYTWASDKLPSKDKFDIEVALLNATYSWPSLKFLCFCRSRDKQIFCNVRPSTLWIVQTQASIKGNWAGLTYRLQNFDKGVLTIAITLFL